ncbi:MAG: ATP-binding cassette domain-containing protein [Candidatus Latescibacteria bacterium]|nr:ATP-binding cassette domain-containing protein [Candidatus Latescibacterota bacterium]
MNSDKKDDSEPLFHAKVPQQVRRELAEVVAPEEEIRLAVTTDIKLDGQYGEAWLMATDTNLVAFSPDGGGPPDIVCLPLADIDAMEVREDLGTAALKVRTQERGATMAVFSKSLVPTLSDLPGQVERLVQQARPSLAGKVLQGRLAGARAGRKRCDRCGQVIPRRYGVCPSCLEKSKLLFRLLSYAKPHWKLISFSLLLMVAATGISLTQPLLNGILIDYVLDASPPEEGTTKPGLGLLEFLAIAEASPQTQLVWLVILLISIFVSGSILSALRSYIMARIGQRVTYGLRNEVYTHLHALSLSYYNQNETGRIMASVTQDVGRLQDFISDGLQEVIRDILTLVFICIILFSYNPSLAALVLLPTPLLVFATLRFGKKLHAIYRPLWHRWAGLSALLADTIPGVRVVKAFAQKKREVGKFKTRSLDLLKGELRVAWMRSLFSPTMTFITSIGTIIIWWVGGHKVLDGALTLGAFVAFTQYMYRFYGPVESLCRLNHRFQRAATSAERVFEVLDTHPEIVDQDQAVPMPLIEGRVEFRNVHFGYEEDKPVIEDLSFTVEPGEMIGLAGHSGAGKSTLINLIGRFYDPQEGSVLIDGLDTRDVELQSLREQIGVVLQDPFLFNGTVAENVAYGHPEADLEKIVAAAKAANAHDFIMKMPDGYDTMVGERGTRVSGGERQRLSIARAILRDPRILILDEATSNVDTQTEAQIQEALERLIRGRTTFAIAHRLSTLKNAHRLLILDEGKLAEMGSHDELIELDGIYANLCRMQTEMSKLRAW